MGEISVILVKNYFFMLLHKFNLHNLINYSVKFQTSVTDVQSFMRPYVNFYAIRYIIKRVFHTKFLNSHFLNISTYSKCKGFHNFYAIKLKFFIHVTQVVMNKIKY